jgi:hypothetical protein
MKKLYVKGPFLAEQFDGSRKMINEYHIHVSNKNFDLYGGFGDPVPDDYQYQGRYIDVGDWFILDSDEHVIDIQHNSQFTADYIPFKQ